MPITIDALTRTPSKVISTLFLADRNTHHTPSYIRHCIATASLTKTYSTIRKPTCSPSCTRITAAPFSVRTNGFHGAPLFWTGLKEKQSTVDTHISKLAFQTSNPFNDPKANNVLLTFVSHLCDIDAKHPEETREKLQAYHEAAKIIRTDLDKMVESAGHTVSRMYTLEEPGVSYF